MMRAASALMVAALLTTSVISGTFAKYVKEESGTDSARVARFGVTIYANGTMFAKEYDRTGSTTNETITKSVISSDDDNVLAPGTSGSLAVSTISGTTEVAVKVAREAQLNLTGWNAQKEINGADEYYCPIRIYVNDQPYYGLAYQDADAFKKAVEDAIKNTGGDYAANTQFSGSQNNDYNLSVTWSWDFEGSENQTDFSDTSLGMNAAGLEQSKIELTVKTTVTQID